MYITAGVENLFLRVEKVSAGVRMSLMWLCLFLLQSLIRCLLDLRCLLRLKKYFLEG